MTYWKLPNIWKLNNILLSDSWAKDEITREIIKYIELNDNESRTDQNSWDQTKGILTGKFIALNDNIRKEVCKINDLSFLLKKLKKEEPS